MALWVLLLVSLASVHCTCATTSYPMLLDLRGRVIGCSSTLQCESPVALVDGNDSTSWNAPQVNSEDIASVTLNLGKEYTITNLYLQLPSIPSPISQLTMQHSTDGDVFQSTRGSLFLDHGTCPRGLCTVMGRDVLVTPTSFLRFQFSQSPSPLNVSVAELGVVVNCSSSLCPECGACVDRLQVKLEEMLDVIATVNASVPPVSMIITVNRTELLRIQDITLLRQESALNWLLQLIAAERVVGFGSQYPANTTLPVDVEQLESNFTDTVINKLATLKNLTAHIGEFVAVNDSSFALMDALRQLQSRLQQVDVTMLLNSTNQLLTNLSTLLSELSANRDSLKDLISQANTTLLLISSRSFMQANVRLVNLETQLDRFANLSALFVSGVQFQTDLMRAAQLLQRVRNISKSVLDDAANVGSAIDLVRTQIVNIQNQFPQAVMLTNMTQLNNGDAQSSGDHTQSLLINGTMSSQEANISLQMLHHLTRNLEGTVMAFQQLLEPFLPTNRSCLSEPGQACIHAEQHARILALNYIRINSSRFAINQALSFLASLPSLHDIDFVAINETAQSAIAISNEALTKLASSNSSGTLSTAGFERDASQSVAAQVNVLQRDAIVEQARAKQQLNRSREQEILFRQLENTVSMLNSTVQQLKSSPDISLASRDINRTADGIRTRLGTTRMRVEQMEMRLPAVEESVRNLSAAVRDAERLLNRTDNNNIQIERLLQEALPLTNSSTTGLTNLTQRNTDLLADIDSLLESVVDMHDLIKVINSAAVMRPTESIQRPYISLQPPPSTMGPNDHFQFETLNMYLTADMGYTPPALLFYAGPAVDTVHGGDRSSLIEADFIAIMALPDKIEVRWRLGPNIGMVSESLQITTSSEIFVTRVGSQLELFATAGTLQNPVQSGTQLNCSLLFRATSNTVYYIGGHPDGVELANRIPQTLNSFIGTYQLILFGGDVWTMWDYRSRSNTDFLDFNTNNRAPNNVLNLVSNRQTISFDGNGYVRSITMFTGIRTPTNSYEFNFQYRSRSTEGLMAYLFDRQRNVSLEVAFIGGELHAELRWRSGIVTDRRPMISMDFDSGSYIIQYSVFIGGIAFDGDIRSFKSTPNFETFEDMSMVEAWFGGVDVSMVKEPFVPRITNSSFNGCITFSISSDSVTHHVFDNSFEENYLKSPVQQRLSGICFKTNHVSQVSFTGQGYLSYNKLVVVSIPNEDSDSGGINAVNLDNQLLLSVSFFPQNSSGVILLARSTQPQGSVMVHLQQGMVVLTIVVGGFSDTVSSPAVTLQVWHQLLVELRFTESGDNVRLFVDGKLSGSTRVNGLANGDEKFSIPIVATNPLPLLVGGSSSSHGNFTGCLKNLAYNYDAIAFLNEAVTPPNAISAPGVSFNRCPFLPERGTALIPLSPPTPVDRTCFSNPPHRLDGTHGGFHSNTRLTSGNIIGLDTQSWNLSFSFRRSPSPHIGRIITITFTSGMIELSVGAGGRSIIVTTRDGGGVVASNGSIPLTSTDTWIDVATQCDAGGTLGRCIVTVMETVGGSTTSSQFTAQLLVGDTFNPQLPLVFGRYEKGGDVSLSFVGCLRDLRVNGDLTGFSNRTTCVACFTDIITADGFSGSSYIRRSVSSALRSISFQFRATQEQGLLLLLTDSTQEPVFGMGLYEGEMRLTNFSSDGYIPLDRSFCANDTSFHTLTLSISSLAVGISLDTVNMTIAINQPPGNTNLIIYIGGVPGDFSVAGGTPNFSFLLSTLSLPGTLPPGFIGCIRQLAFTPSPEQEALSEGILANYCPQPAQ